MKPKIVLFALNASYTHTNLAVRCLRRSLRASGFDDITVIERSLRDRRDDVLEALYRERADIYGFSAYIWNITEMLRIARSLKRLCPACTIVFGGPEVSYETERFDACDFIDHIIRGEGEDAFPALCRKWEEGLPVPRITDGGIPCVMRDEGILYEKEELRGNELLYYESSRGCPFSCAYCLSSLDRTVRAKSAEQTVSELAALTRLAPGARTVKLVDRTFNFDIKRANTIWRALLDDRFSAQYHFEICASLLDEESFAILSKMPPGRVRLEIGLQSTNPRTLEEISRHTDAEKVLANTKRLHDMGNLHVHLDLIAGLPYESYARFGRSFDEAYPCADVLQLGFLKLLPGTRLARDAEKYGYVSEYDPPYTVLAGRNISREELYRLSGISDLLERYHDSGAFQNTLAYALSACSSPFAFYEGLYDSLCGRPVRQLSQADAYSALYHYALSLVPDKEELERALHTDYSAHEVRRLSSKKL